MCVLHITLAVWRNGERSTYPHVGCGDSPQDNLLIIIISLFLSSNLTPFAYQNSASAV
jgi:hypothetical protein